MWMEIRLSWTVLDSIPQGLAGRDEGNASRPMGCATAKLRETRSMAAARTAVPPVLWKRYTRVRLAFRLYRSKPLAS